MNHLAHLALADGDDGLRLGALLGDYVKGQDALARLPSTWSRGVRLHRKIDAWSDHHPAVRTFLASLQPPWRRYGGVITDVLFDCMLSRHWRRFGPAPLASFAESTDDLFFRYQQELPQRLVRFAVWARQNRLWERYQDRAMLEQIFAGLARRHARKSPLASGLDLLDRHEAEIERLFLTMFPDLQVRVHDWRQAQSSMSSM